MRAQFCSQPGRPPTFLDSSAHERVQLSALQLHGILPRPLTPLLLWLHLMRSNGQVQKTGALGAAPPAAPLVLRDYQRRVGVAYGCDDMPCVSMLPVAVLCAAGWRRREASEH